MISCIFEDGGKGSLRHVSVNGIVLNEKGELLLNKRAPHITNGNKFGLIGGFLDRDETTKECVIRELKEEAGIEGEVQTLFQIKDNPDRPQEDRQNVEFVYIVKAKSDDVKGSSEGEVFWFSLDKLPDQKEFAFDHFETIQKFKEYKKSSFSLPIIPS
ncbi:MAG TPA: NUDIX hydrolase [Candidatus Saccharimonadales bacterium]|nr:NUDIX hydrolase [Candidatus Saccharimonadales bacterium]